MADFLDAFKQGWGNAQQAADDWRHNQAMNALTKIYGPVAGDPQAALQLQEYGQREKMNPLLITNQELSNEGLTNQNNYLKKSYPLLLEHQGEVNTGQQENNTLAGQKIEAGNISLAATKAQQLHGVLSGTISDLGTSLKGVTDPTQRGQIFDQAVAKLAPMIGLDPQQAAQQLAAERQAVVQNGDAALPQMQTDLDSAIYGMMSPKDRAAIASTQAHTDLYNAQAGEANAKAKAATAASGLAMHKAGLDVSSLRQKYASTVGNMQRVQQLVPQIDAALAAAKKLGGHVPVNALEAELRFGAGNDYRQAAEPVEHQLALIDFQNLLASGMHFGRITNTQFNAASKAYANLSVAQDPATIQKNLETIKGVIPQLMEPYQTQLGDLKKQIHAAGGLAPDEDQQSSAGAGAVVTAHAIATTPGATTHSSTGNPLPGGTTSPVALAAKWVGAGENSDKGALSAFFKKSAGENIDPSKTPWCAAFVNAVLGQTGEGGTGSLAARSFLHYGDPVKTPSKGDIVVMSRGAPGSGEGHVGFFVGMTSRNGKQYVQVLGGNTGNKVAVAEYPIASVLGYRRPPKAGDIAKGASSVLASAQGGGAPAPEQGGGNTPAMPAQPAGGNVVKPKQTPQNTVPAAAPAAPGNVSSPAQPVAAGTVPTPAPQAPVAIGPVKTLGDAQAILRQMGVLK